VSFCDWFKKPTRNYECVIHLNGRHPYLKEKTLDYDTKDATVIVAASDWNAAARKALEVGGNIPDHWSCWIKSMKRVD